MILCARSRCASGALTPSSNWRTLTYSIYPSPEMAQLADYHWGRVLSLWFRRLFGSFEKAAKHMLLVGALAKVTLEVVVRYPPLVCHANITTGQEKGQIVVTPNADLVVNDATTGRRQGDGERDSPVSHPLCYDNGVGRRESIVGSSVGISVGSGVNVAVGVGSSASIRSTRRSTNSTGKDAS
jgi:hypothetical protein